MGDVNVRIPEDVADELRMAAQRRQMSMSEFVRQLLESALMTRAVMTEAVPIGLSDVAKELDDWNGTPRNHWLFVYRAASGRTLIATGSIDKVEPMFVKLRLTSSDKYLAIPRPSLVAWKTLQSQSAGEIFPEVHALQQWGAYLHPAILGDSRTQNGIQFPP